MSEVVRKAQIENSRIPKRYQKNMQLVPQQCDIAAYQELAKISDNIKTFVKDGNGLLIFSKNCGNGKTTAVCRLALRYITDYASNYAIEVPVVFVNAAEYITNKKAAISDKSLVEVVNKLDKDIKNADIVIWDDIATKALSDYDMEQLYVLINHRYSEMKSNFYTSNCSRSDMATIMGQRLTSRVLNDSKVIELNGFDNRKCDY